MNQIYNRASDALAAAYALAKVTGQRVWRHTAENKYGQARWFISYEKDAHTALQGLAA